MRGVDFYKPEDVAAYEQQLAAAGRLNAGTVPTAGLPTLVSASELFRGDVVRLRPLFDGLLWDGLTMLIAKPKAGKSWLTLQSAVHVAGGRRLSGINASDTGPVLYAALEEPQARTMARLRSIADAGPWAANLHFVYDLLPLMGGGAQQLAALIENLHPRLVVLDTLTALIKGGGGKSSNDVFRSQYGEVTRVRKLSEDAKTAVILVHHTRKGDSDDPIEAIAGTGGIGAAIDTVWHIKRRPEGEGVLTVLGREVEENKLALRFESEQPFGWRILGDDAAQLLNAERREVLALLSEEGALTPAQIAMELGKSRPAVRQMLKRMRDDMQVQKQGTKYTPSLSMSHRVTERERD